MQVRSCSWSLILWISNAKMSCSCVHFPVASCWIWWHKYLCFFITSWINSWRPDKKTLHIQHNYSELEKMFRGKGLQIYAEKWCKNMNTRKWWTYATKMWWIMHAVEPQSLTNLMHDVIKWEQGYLTLNYQPYFECWFHHKFYAFLFFMSIHLCGKTSHFIYNNHKLMYMNDFILENDKMTTNFYYFSYHLTCSDTFHFIFFYEFN